MRKLDTEDIRKIIRFAYESRGHECTEELIDKVIKEDRQDMFIEWFGEKAIECKVVEM